MTAEEGENGHLLFWDSWMRKGGSFVDAALQGCFNATSEWSELAVGVA